MEANPGGYPNAWIAEWLDAPRNELRDITRAHSLLCDELARVLKIINFRQRNSYSRSIVGRLIISMFQFLSMVSRCLSLLSTTTVCIQSTLLFMLMLCNGFHATTLLKRRIPSFILSPLVTTQDKP